MPSPPLSRRIDHFAQVALGALLSIDREKALIREEQATGVPREVILARKAYEIAEALEAEAEKHS